jgi:hypothetical protein
VLQVLGLVSKERRLEQPVLQALQQAQQLLVLEKQQAVQGPVVKELAHRRFEQLPCGAQVFRFSPKIRPRFYRLREQVLSHT